MNFFGLALDEVNAIERDQLTLNQRLKVAEIKALLSISQELSKIHHEGINPKYETFDGD